MKSDGIILTVAAFGAGKTFSLNTLRQTALELDIPFEPRAISDQQHIIAALLEDEANGGLNHYHADDVKFSGPHLHNGEPTRFPFVCTSNVIPLGMYARFFQKLSQIHNIGQLYFAEWAGGININTEGHPARNVNFGFDSIGRDLRNGNYSMAWIPSVVAVIHPVADFPLRVGLNDTRRMPTLEEIEFGTASLPLLPEVMRMAGKDDFIGSELERLFCENGVPIYEIHNNGTPAYETELTYTAREIFRPFCSAPETLHRGLCIETL